MEKIVLIIDFGSQYTELLVKKVRQNSIFTEVKEFNDPDLIKESDKYSAIIISGSPSSAKEELHEDIFLKLISLKKPMLCICYGMQVIHKILGGKVVYEQSSEFGSTEIKIVKNHDLISGMPTKFTTWMSHNDSVIEIAPGFTSIATTKVCHAIAADDKRQIYTIQMHPEVEHSNYGSQLITNFLLLICKLKQNWKVENIIEKKVHFIKEKAGKEKIYLALSGGVDSVVVAELMKKAEVNAHYIFVDTGLMWDQKMSEIIKWLESELKDRLIIIDARERFLKSLSGISDPEQKRKVVGNLFIEIFSEELKKRGNSKFLAQGTIRSDLIESGKQRQARVIKTHHNTIEDLRTKFDIIEPIADLFKNEVKSLARQLHVPSLIVDSKPFPGPGYAIRILGEITKEKLDILKKVDQILIEELETRGLYQEISQCFAVMVEGKTVGVIGDQRNYGHIIAIRCINSQNMMTAKPSLIPTNILLEISDSIINQVREVVRVVYDLTSKPPATIEWE